MRFHSIIGEDRGQSVDCGFYIGSMIGLDVVGGEAVTHRIPWCDVSCDVPR